MYTVFVLDLSNKLKESVMMKNIALILVAGLSLMISACGGSDSNSAQSTLQVNADGTSTMNVTLLQTQLSNLPLGTLSDDETAGLLLMRQEEKLARDVYLALYNLHGTPIFNNISDSEQTHTDAVLALLDRYGLTDPVATAGLGEFADETLQTLYDDLVYQGTPTLVDGLIVGVTIEELDIYDIARLSEQLDDNDDIALVYSQLQRGSRNHLRAFYKQLVANGGSYIPQYITQDEFDDIINSDMETGK